LHQSQQPAITFKLSAGFSAIETSANKSRAGLGSEKLALLRDLQAVLQGRVSSSWLRPSAAWGRHILFMLGSLATIPAGKCAVLSGFSTTEQLEHCCLQDGECAGLVPVLI
jgi:hypothetical protein